MNARFESGSGWSAIQSAHPTTKLKRNQQRSRDLSWERWEMDDTLNAELYRQEGEQFRSVRLSVKPDGAVRLDAQDMGEIVERTWGDDDYEFWVDVPPTSIRKLLFALLRDRYADRAGAVDEFRAFCKKENIEHKWDSWI
jgi:hypothetical protein